MREFKSCHLGHLTNLLQEGNACTYIVEKSWGLQPFYILLLSFFLPIFSTSSPPPPTYTHEAAS